MVRGRLVTRRVAKIPMVLDLPLKGNLSKLGRATQNEPSWIKFSLPEVVQRVKVYDA